MSARYQTLKTYLSYSNAIVIALTNPQATVNLLINCSLLPEEIKFAAKINDSECQYIAKIIKANKEPDLFLYKCTNSICKK